MIRRKQQCEREVIQEPALTPVVQTEGTTFSYEDAYKLRAAIRIVAHDMVRDDLSTSTLQGDARYLAIPGQLIDSLTDSELLKLGWITNAYHLNNASRNARYRKKAFIICGLGIASILSFLAFSLTANFHLSMAAKIAISTISNVLVCISLARAISFIFEFVRTYRKESVIENSALIDLTNRLIEEKARRT